MGMDSTKYGGIEKFNVELSAQLSALKIRSIFVYERYPDVSGFADDLIATGASIVVLPSRHSAFHFIVGITKIIITNSVDIVHCHFTKARFYAIPVARFLGVKCILYTFHSTVDDISKIKFHTKLWYRYANRFSKVIGVSDRIVSDAINNWGKNIDIERHYLGVPQIVGVKSECRSNLKISSSEFVILTVANFNHIKGLDTLCLAVKILVANNQLPSNAKFYIVGQPEKDIEELNGLINRTGIGNYVKMTGISNSVPQYMCAADLYVQPSRAEGLPLALMEATSVGLPIVASNVGGIPEVVKNSFNGLLFNAGDATDLADNIVRITTGTICSLSEFSKKSIEVYTEKFSLVDNVKGLISVYDKMTKS